MIGMRLGISINRNPRAMASQSKKKYSHGKSEIVWPKITKSREREKETKSREKFSRNRFPIQLRCAHVLRTAPVLNKPYDSCAHTHP